jgi:hypothetical protein
LLTLFKNSVSDEYANVNKVWVNLREI